jgi:hypothetical protein
VGYWSCRTQPYNQTGIPRIKHKRQSERFKEAARELGADQKIDALDRIVRQWRARNGGRTIVGKQAINEQAKLRATFLNNCGVGLAVTGALLPMASFYYQIPEWVDGKGPKTLAIICGAAAVFGAWVGAWVLHRFAQNIAREIQD